MSSLDALREHRQRLETADRRAPSGSPRALNVAQAIAEAKTRIKHGVPCPVNRLPQSKYNELFDAMTIGDSFTVDKSLKSRFAKAVDQRNKAERAAKSNRKFVGRLLPDAFGIWCLEVGK